VIKVHDADTITIIFEYHGEIIKYNVQIAGVDAPELHSKVDKEKELSQKGQKYVSDLILNSIIKIKFQDFDKYGRLLGEVVLLSSPKSKTIKEMNLSDLLIDGGYARKYDGGHKDEWNLQ
jgi:endonuclease YncB( thermonuclease family)